MERLPNEQLVLFDTEGYAEAIDAVKIPIRHILRYAVEYDALDDPRGIAEEGEW